MLGGRLQDGASIAQAALEISAAVRRSPRRPPATGRCVSAPLPVSRAGGNRNVIAAFAAAVMTLVSMVLGVACANTAGLLSARSTFADARCHFEPPLGPAAVGWFANSSQRS